ncbi:uncharacterized protein LOC128200543 [Galleria mellonella]|uniref:Uncharacterized protein LOC128200543 n=1 Tax=Galleria mellonella TaxID=7137 RepID=A0ABM3MGL9_GALME|nr:uncharacterized protein LOC128200543 [Galleria mellonella]
MSANSACNLDCIKSLAPVHEFEGPVKIVLVDVPKATYIGRLWHAACIVLANMLIGATTFTVLCYTLCFRASFSITLHIVLCTIGYQLLIPSGVLMMNFLHGAAAPQKVSGRRGEHVFIQLCGLACAAAGSFVVFLLEGRITTRTHIIFGVPAFVASSVCFVLGIHKKAFAKWVSMPDMVIFLTIFCFFYTLIIIYKPLKKLLTKKTNIGHCGVPSVLV